tara:strand:+ start:1437 stop:1937 length:501 start_codon:yes stop_codon:yes gene_type:complete
MKYLLNTINKIKNKSIKVNRASISYNNSKHVGILYKYIDENKQKALNDFKNKIISDGIRVDFLPSIRKKNADNRYFKTFKSDEINMFGNWSNNNVNLFIYQQYDFIIYPDLYLSYDMENILIRSNAKCRVGFIENKFNLFELLIKSDKDYDIDHRLNKLYHYLKKV